MKILLTNDDGIHAPGLAALQRAVDEAFDNTAHVIIVAPDRPRSECGHSITTSRPLKLKRLSRDRFSVDGTPVDCVRAALASSLASEVDLVISGVNAGANVGIDLLVSGTFAAAREAALHGLPAMACSHYRRPDVPKTWDHVPRWLLPVIHDFAAQSISLAQRKVQGQGDTNSDQPKEQTFGILWNVNLPAIDTSKDPSRVLCPVDRCQTPREAQHQGDFVELKSDFHGRPRDRGTDVDLCFSGHLTISQLTPHLA